jgi:transcriptional regulator with XRE-family HTH domain
LVQEYRASRGVSQAELARRIGHTPGYVGLIEIGRRGDRPKYDLIIRITQALKCSVEETEALLRVTGHLDEDEHLFNGLRPTFPVVTEADPFLTSEQKAMFLNLYRMLTGR